MYDREFNFIIDDSAGRGSLNKYSEKVFKEAKNSARSTVTAVVIR